MADLPERSANPDGPPTAPAGGFPIDALTLSAGTNNAGQLGTPIRSMPMPVLNGYEFLDRDPLGIGGMGAVWRARQLGTCQEVAIKFLGLRYANESGRARFVREVQLSARLHHRHIARIYDSGVHRESYFYAMELVEGVPLATHLKNGLCDLRRPVLDLMRDVCRAVGHAHRNSIIHRDLKPSNLMVTPEGEPKVLDFGLAEAVLLAAGGPGAAAGDGVLRVADPSAGTPEYMAPEQKAGDADHVGPWTDVYSLGKILLEVLDGAPSRGVDLTDEATLKAAVRRAARGERGGGGEPHWAAPFLPRWWPRWRRAELETLMLKALDPVAGRRFRAADELASDLDNYLDRRPVTARPRSRMYALRKGAERHWVGTLLALVLLLSTTGYTAFFLARLALRWQEVNAAKAYMADFFLPADPGKSQGREVTARELSDRVNHDMPIKFARKPRGEAMIREGLGRVLFSRGEFALAEAQLEQLVKLRTGALRDADPLATATAMDLQAQALRELNQLPAAQTLAEQAVAIRQAKLGEDASETLLAINTLACVQRDLGLYHLAFKRLEAALKHTDALSDPAHWSEPALVLTRTLVMVLRDRHEPTDLTTADHLAWAVLAGRQAMNSGPTDPQLLEAMKDLSSVLAAEESYDEAEFWCKKAIDGAIVSKRGHPDLATWRGDLATIYYHLDDLTRAEETSKTAYEESRTLRGKDHPYTVVILENYASFLAIDTNPAKWPDAKRLMTDALQSLRDNGKSEADEHVTAMSNALTKTLVNHGELEDACKTSETHFQALKARHAAPAAIRAAAANLVGVLRLRGETNEADKLQREYDLPIDQ